MKIIRKLVVDNQSKLLFVKDIQAEWLQVSMEDGLIFLTFLENELKVDLGRVVQDEI